MQWWVWQQIRNDTRYSVVARLRCEQHVAQTSSNGAWHDVLRAKVNEVSPSSSSRFRYNKPSALPKSHLTNRIAILNASLATCTSCFKNAAQAESRPLCRGRGLDLPHVKSASTHGLYDQGPEVKATMQYYSSIACCASIIITLSEA
jgi:hypothetical protein